MKKLENLVFLLVVFYVMLILNMWVSRVCEMCSERLFKKMVSKKVYLKFLKMVYRMLCLLIWYFMIVRVMLFSLLNIMMMEN